MNAFLYQPMPKGFERAIETALDFNDTFGPNSVRVWEYQACAYSQQYMFLSNAPSRRGRLESIFRRPGFRRNTWATCRYFRACSLHRFRESFNEQCLTRNEYKLGEQSMICSITRAKVSTSRILACATIVLSISGCAGLSALQDSVSHLDQAAHSAATAEAAFLVALNVADCESQFYKQTYLYSSGAATNFQIAKYCSPQVITPAQIKIRNDLMSAVVLYADKMMALASTDSDKTLSTDSQTVAGNLKKLAGSGSGTSTIVAGVAAAFTAIAELALDEKRYKNHRNADEHRHGDRCTAENRVFSVTIVAADKVLESQLRAEAASAKTVVEKFNAIVRAREILAAESGQSLAALGTIDWDATDLSKPISDSLPGIKTANAAIAKGSSANIYAAAHDLYARASAARDLYTSISTAK